MKRAFLVFLFGILASAQGFSYYVRPTLNITYDEYDNGRLMLRGSGLCDSDAFRVRIIDSVTGDAGWYQSRSGNIQWPITRQSNGDCRIEMQLSKRVLVPGNVL